MNQFYHIYVFTASKKFVILNSMQNKQ